MNDGAGFQIDAFDTDLNVMMPYNLLGHPHHAEPAGYYKGKALSPRSSTRAGPGLDARSRNKGFDMLLIYEIYKRGMARGYKRAELSWVLEDNKDMNRSIGTIGAELYNTYRVYQKVIEGSKERRCVLCPGLYRYQHKAPARGIRCPLER